MHRIYIQFAFVENASHLERAIRASANFGAVQFETIISSCSEHTAAQQSTEQIEPRTNVKSLMSS
jgi:hypothetical protein